MSRRNIRQAQKTSYAARQFHHSNLVMQFLHDSHNPLSSTDKRNSVNGKQCRRSIAEENHTSNDDLKAAAKRHHK
jgi:hypothetical protein